jgi:methylthioribose-1-phosphate isomerase
MRVNGIHRRSIIAAHDQRGVEVIDQRALPHALSTVTLRTENDVSRAIREMWVRGAPLIGAVAAYGLCFAVREDASEAGIERACRLLLATRPTAVNLRWALDEMREALLAVSAAERFDTGWRRAQAICDDDVAINLAIGKHGLKLLADLFSRSGSSRLNVLTHCNAGWIATVDFGTALSPIYMAHDAGMPVHVWVDETRPRNQGALTAWELREHGVPHTLVVDNAGGHLMQHGLVDLCMVGADRVTTGGDVCNKIGTYLKALAAKDNGVPFYVALPYPTIDWTAEHGIGSIPIEERDPGEVYCVRGAVDDVDLAGPVPPGLDEVGQAGPVSRGQLAATPVPRWGSVRPYGAGTRAANYAFDITPAKLITGLVTERGIAPASREGLASLYPERLEPTFASTRGARS